MSWQMYRWIWRVESPLHIGAPPAGALNRTRLYVPARALWGALTAELARRRSLQSSSQVPDYQSVGQALQTNTRLGYLFPAEQVNGEWKAWLPRYQEDVGLVWEREGDRKILEDRPFRRRLLITRPGTAIEPESDTAAEGTLREFELISPYWREAGGECRPVAMVGYLFCKDPTLKAEICQVEELFVGGDTRYGLGRLTCAAREQTRRFFDSIQLDLEAVPPTVTIARILAHARVRTGKDLLGAMECLGGWDLVQGGLKRGELVWAPGSSFDQGHDFKLGEDGLWSQWVTGAA